MHVIMCVCVTRLTADIPPVAGLPILACMHHPDNIGSLHVRWHGRKFPALIGYGDHSALHEMNSCCSFMSLSFVSGIMVG